MPNAAKPIIDMRNVSKTYTVGGEEVRALHRATLTIREGGVCRHRRAQRFGQVHADEHYGMPGRGGQRGIPAGRA